MLKYMNYSNPQQCFFFITLLLGCVQGRFVCSISVTRSTFYNIQGHKSTRKKQNDESVFSVFPLIDLLYLFTANVVYLKTFDCLKCFEAVKSFSFDCGTVCTVLKTNLRCFFSDKIYSWQGLNETALQSHWHRLPAVLKWLSQCLLRPEFHLLIL